MGVSFSFTQSWIFFMIFWSVLLLWIYYNIVIWDEHDLYLCLQDNKIHVGDTGSVWFFIFISKDTYETHSKYCKWIYIRWGYVLNYGNIIWILLFKASEIGCVETNIVIRAYSSSLRKSSVGTMLPGVWRGKRRR